MDPTLQGNTALSDQNSSPVGFPPVEDSASPFSPSPSPVGGGVATTTVITSQNSNPGPAGKGKGKMVGKVVSLTLGVLILVAGVVAGTVLIRQRQEVREKAAVTTGVAKVRISPTTATLDVDETLEAKIWLDTAGRSISTVTVQADYDFGGNDNFLEVESIVLNSQLVSSGYWTFPIKKATVINGNVQIRIAGINTSIAGFSASTETLLATITFKANSAGTTTVSFDSAESKISEKSTAQDILLIPVSTATYTVSGGGPTPSPTPEPTEEPEPTPRPSPPFSYGGPPECTAAEPDAPIILSAVKSGTTVKLTWTEVDLADHYAISYGTQSGKYVYGVSNTRDVTTYTIKSLSASKKYYFIVYAVNDCMPSSASLEMASTGGTSGAVATSTPAPDSEDAPIPETGISTPTIIGIGLGLVMLGASALLAL